MRNPSRNAKPSPALQRSTRSSRSVTARSLTVNVRICRSSGAASDQKSRPMCVVATTNESDAPQAGYLQNCSTRGRGFRRLRVPVAHPYICAGVGISEYGFELDSGLLLGHEHVIQGAQQASLRGTGDRLTHGHRLDQTRGHCTTRARLGRLLALGQLRAGLLGGAFLVLHLAILGAQPLELLRSDDDAARVDLVVLEELSKLGGH